MYSDTPFTQQVKELLKNISSPENYSVLSQASVFFSQKIPVEQKLTSYHESIIELNSKLAQQASAKNKALYQRKLAAAESGLKAFTEQQQELRLVRHDTLVPIAREILSLTEGVDFEETQRKSAKLLGTIQLLSPTEGKQVAENNDRSKHLYKAILCLRLFDQLFINDMITDPYILKALKDISPAQYQSFINDEEESYQAFAEKVKIPLIMVAILQDIGNHHPIAKTILYGESSTANPYRVLEPTERKKLLQTNYSETMKYISQGIGAGKYIGNLKAEREVFDISEKQKVVFMQSILKRWANSKDIIGNLLKVPQVYTSIILSTKGNFDYRLLPKVYQVLKLNVERGHCLAEVVDCLYKITGMFPMGYGITYIPKDSAGQASDRFEYAIVTRLYPDDVKQPECRVATRSLTFISRGQDIRIEKSSNLYFPETSKTLSTMSKERLDEILELLASNYHERKKSDVIPRCWHAKEYFSIGKNQNLWNRVSDH
jgi:hypothetical protein